MAQDAGPYALDDARVGHVLCERGLVASTRLAEAIEQTVRLRAAGDPTATVGQVLLRAGAISAPHLVNAFAQLGHAVFVCGGCLLPYHLPASLAQPLLACPRCRAPLRSAVECSDLEVFGRVLASRPIESLAGLAAPPGPSGAPAPPALAIGQPPSNPTPAPGTPFPRTPAPATGYTPAPPPGGTPSPAFAGGPSPVTPAGAALPPLPPPAGGYAHPAPTTPASGALPALGRTGSGRFPTMTPGQTPAEVPSSRRVRVIQASHPTPGSSRGLAALASGQSITPHLPRIGDYIIHDELGRGGMGAVYRVEHAGTRQRYALKVLLPSGDPRSMEARRNRFLREVQAITSLKHESITAVHDVGSHGDLAYYVMDLIEGKTLQEHIGQTGYARRGGLEVLEKVARGVHAAHEQGVVHRDLKPANILVDERGEPHIVDFGLAFIQGEDRLTRTGSAIGTPFYMAPEQIRAKVDDLDGRADVFALGIILYEILTGQPPFRGVTPAEVYMKILEQKATPPSQVDPAVDPAYDAICLKAIEKDPRDRYQSAGELADDLARKRGGEAVAVKRASPVRRLMRLVEAWPRASAGVALGAVAILILSVVAIRLATSGVADPAVARLQDEAARLKAELARLERIKSGEGAPDEAAKLKSQLDEVEKKLRGGPASPPPAGGGGGELPPEVKQKLDALASAVADPDAEPTAVIELARAIVGTVAPGTPAFERASAAVAREEEWNRAFDYRSARARDAVEIDGSFADAMKELGQLPGELLADEARWGVRVERLRATLSEKALELADGHEGAAKTALRAGELETARAELRKLARLGHPERDEVAAQGLREVEAAITARAEAEKKQKAAAEAARKERLERARAAMTELRAWAGARAREGRFADAIAACEKLASSDPPEEVAGELALLRGDLENAAHFRELAVAALARRVGERVRLRARDGREVRYEGEVVAVVDGELTLSIASGAQKVLIANIDQRDLAAQVDLREVAGGDAKSSGGQGRVLAGIYLLLSGRAAAAREHLDAAAALGAPGIDRLLGGLDEARRIEREAEARARYAALADDARDVDRVLRAAAELSTQYGGTEAQKRFDAAIGVLGELAPLAEVLDPRLTREGGVAVAWDLADERTLGALRVAPWRSEVPLWGAGPQRRALSAYNARITTPVVLAAPYRIALEADLRPIEKQGGELVLVGAGVSVAIEVSSKSARLVVRDAKGAEVKSELIEPPNRAFSLALAVDADGGARVTIDETTVAEANVPIDPKEAGKPVQVTLLIGRGPVRLERLKAEGPLLAEPLVSELSWIASVIKRLKAGERGKAAKVVQGAFSKTPAGLGFRGNRFVWSSEGKMSIVSIQKFDRPLFTATLGKLDAADAQVVFWEPPPNKDAAKTARRLSLPTYPDAKREVVAFHHEKKFHLLVDGVRVASVDAAASNVQLGFDCGAGTWKLDGLVIRQLEPPAAGK